MKTSIRLAISISVCIATWFGVSAHAQQAGSAAAPSSTAAVPPMSCQNPGDSVGIEPTKAQVDRFQKRIDEYKRCVDEYSRSMGAKANEHIELAKTYTAAANGAITTYNDYVTALNARSKGTPGEPNAKPVLPAADKPRY